MATQTLTRNSRIIDSHKPNQSTSSTQQQTLQNQISRKVLEAQHFTTWCSAMVERVFRAHGVVVLLGLLLMVAPHQAMGQTTAGRVRFSIVCVNDRNQPHANIDLKRCTDEAFKRLTKETTDPSPLQWFLLGDVILKYSAKYDSLRDDNTIALTVYDADTNNIKWTEQRTVVDEQNDVRRLEQHMRRALITQAETPKQTAVSSLLETTRQAGDAFVIAHPEYVDSVANGELMYKQARAMFGDGVWTEANFEDAYKYLVIRGLLVTKK